MSNRTIPWRDYYLLMRMDKPIGILLLLWPTLWALWLAGEGRPDPWVVVVFVLGVVFMRSAGCVINDYADREFDPHVERTKDRPIAAGRVSPREALLLFLVLVSISFGLVLTQNWLTILLSIPAALLAASYPFAKRFTHLPQAHLGAAFGWAVPMAWAAQTGSVPPVAWGLFLLVLIWAVIYDTFYAMVDREDDLKIGVKSSAILFGRYDQLITSVLQLVLLIGLAWLGLALGLGPEYFSCLGLAAALMVWQQYLISVKNLCFRAFLNNNYLGAAIFAGIFLTSSV